MAFTLLRTLQDLGTTNVFFKEKNTDTRLAASIFGFIILITAALSLIAWFFGSPVLSFFGGTDRSIEIFKVLIFCFALSAVGTLHEAILRKKMQFKALFYINTATSIISSAVGIGCALAGMDVFSLVYKQLTFIVFSHLAYYLATSEAKIPSFKLTPIKTHLGFSAFMVTDQTLSFLSRNLDSLLVGKFLGAAALGLYDRAYKFLTLPIQQVGGSVSKVLLPSLSNKENDQERNDLMLKSIGLSSLVIAPLMLGLAALAREFTLVVMTDKWLGLVPMLTVFAILSCFQTVSTLLGNLFIVKGKSRPLMLFGLVTKSIYVSIFYYCTAVLGDVYILVYAYAVASLMASLPFWYLASKNTGLEYLRIIKIFLWAFIPAVAMAGCIYILKKTSLSGENLPGLMALSFIGGVLYFVLIRWSRFPYLGEMIKMVKSGGKLGENRN